MSPLDEYADEELAALYDLQYASWTDDLPLYESFAQRGELPSLELMVGTGRVALHLARNGHRVVGIDNSLSMLARLEAQLDRETAPARDRIRHVGIPAGVGEADGRARGAGNEMGRGGESGERATRGEGAGRDHALRVECTMRG